MSAVSESKPKSSDPLPPKWHAARMWLGSNFTGIVKLLARNGFRVSPSRWHVAVTDVIYSIGHSGLGLLQQALLGRAVDRTEFEAEPLFILGHWRTGTTLLHELLILDERHQYPTTYQCFAPNHFLLTEWSAPLVKFILPQARPMDNMRVGWQRPQEDEFALCNLGIPSPYLTIAFPNEPPAFDEYLELEGIPPRDLEKWKRALMRFLKQINYRRPGRIVLKSPPHTARLHVLNDMFPRAKYVHIIRNPYVLFASTVKTWKSLYMAHGLQVPRYEGLEEYVFRTFVRMFDQLEKTRPLIDENRFYELRYEDLVADPIGEVRALYEHLNLGGFDTVEPKLKAYFEELGDYRTNQYNISPEMRERIYSRWGKYIDKYGYGGE